MTEPTFDEDKQEWRDENGNTATVRYFGSKEKAKAALDSLEHCRNCTNCSYCSYCLDCSDCRACVHGFGCRSCVDCTHCSGCRQCHNCINCHACRDCRYCRYCRNCRNCVDCRYCRDCRHCRDCRGCQQGHELLTCQISGWLGGYTFHIYGTKARVGCQEYTIEQWLSFTRDDIIMMEEDDMEKAAEWHRLYWPAFTALLKAEQLRNAK